MINKVIIEIPGEPVGKGRPRAARRGAGIVLYTPGKTASYENLAKLAAARAMAGSAPIDGAVAMHMVINVTAPASWSKKKRAAALNGEVKPTTKPDIDNIIKAVADAFNGVVWLDDKQVVSVTASKHYADAPGVIVTVQRID